MMFILWGLVITVVTAYAGIAAMLYFRQTGLVFLPLREMRATPRSIGLDYEEINLTAEDGAEIMGWFIPHPQARGTVYFLHGNAGNISTRMVTIEMLHHLRMNTFIIEYRGYGPNKGTPSELGCYLDAKAGWRYLLYERGLSPEEVIVFGRSLGGGIALGLMELIEEEPKALILESTFTSIPDMGALQYPYLPIRTLARIRFDNLNRTHCAICPTLIIHSPEDDLIPYDHGKLLFERVPEPKEFLDIAGPHDEGFMLSADLYLEGLEAFITRQFGP